ncbi:hypothetical protein [Ornithinimicrobium sp. INDO-MA30-4]|uniref:hypothetical protein n=1 Tax=Ornithinimicrobium sp. INDO-MA30-4 TaxID=2908651 RepID=UPI001F3402D2|nr:hypothetical protein [Ornithinimicrobium sp. INDO-MA30-4]UJH70028.1 hypothetical protein L0A91_12525 [Ornithinimicrobium sp. INDO-MA30-4]
MDEVWVKHRIVNQPQRVAMKRIPGFSLWWVVIELPEGSRVDYHLETRVGEHHSDFNDPLNPNWLQARWDRPLSRRPSATRP